ncbi:hypothetical protein K4L06_17345 [Lysobacter sp. BMK333-48F3]|uniref:hypothetical protein n=1 Tax=Lysobacter sp. BMK333-48F3 TaxID=2867962 RepID=UPI001C8BB3A1|nr:hypothetical protein [Lysobacter sp. BMK333-48F3]MBX9403077.1 hypothetical protein [Lysobacter sp. BMK333-48F3]
MSCDGAPTAVAQTPAEGLVEALLRAWECAHAASAAERALHLLAAVWPQYDRSYWSRLALGDRDACLLLLQQGLFGGQLRTVAACPACGERLESGFRADELCPLPSRLPTPPEPAWLAHRRYRIEYRPPCSDDVIDLDPRRSAEENVARLLQRCVLSARDGDAPVAVDTLPATLRKRLIAAMAELDPQADLQLTIACPACQHRWQAALDVAGYLWEELDDWAQDLLSEVHVLARHYAWSERDILAMTPVRRRFYLDLVQA